MTRLEKEWGNFGALRTLSVSLLVLVAVAGVVHAVELQKRQSVPAAFVQAPGSKELFLETDHRSTKLIRLLDARDSDLSQGGDLAVAAALHQLLLAATATRMAVFAQLEAPGADRPTLRRLSSWQ